MNAPVSMIEATSLFILYGLPLDADNMRADVDAANQFGRCFGESFVLLQTYAAHRRAKVEKI